MDYFSAFIKEVVGPHIALFGRPFYFFSAMHCVKNRIDILAKAIKAASEDNDLKGTFL